jgi:hypothetical protein
MDLNEYWQENKRFVMIVIAGLIVFMIGEMTIGALIKSDLDVQERRLRALSSELRSPRYKARDLTEAKAENQSLRDASDILIGSVNFAPREAFRVDPDGGSLGNQYFATVSRVRDALLRDAGRAGVRIVPDLGLPAMAPTRDEEIVRHLDALDLIERVLRLAIAEGVERVDRIKIKLDPKLGARKGVGLVEKTRVEMRLSGASAPLLRLIVATQTPANGPSILIDTLEMVPERLKTDEAKLHITFLAPRLKVLAEPEEN